MNWLILPFYTFIVFSNAFGAEEPERCSTRPLTWQNALCCTSTCGKGWKKLPLLLVSMDGFRADYLKRDKTPSIQSLINCGSHAPFIYPSYPSKTFPNHYTIVTGLYPESHGIVDNTMYDPTVEPPEDRFFSRPKPSAKNPKWWRGEPIWNTVMKSGMKAAAYFWPGTEARIQNMSPTYYYNYNVSTPFYQRVDQIVEWLKMDDATRPDFMTMYFDEPDHTGHLFGPDSEKITNQLVIVDAFINYLLRKIFENGLLHCLNIVMLADHGMQALNRDYMKLSDYVDTTNMLVYGGPIGRIMLNNSTVKANELIEKMTCKYEHARVYKTEEVPKRFHYSAIKNRQGDIIVELDPGYTFFQAPMNWSDDYNGDHGFDYKIDSMHALFLAYGPKFKQNYTLNPFQNVELYNLFADTLEIPYDLRAPNNGTVGRLHHVFIDPPMTKVQAPIGFQFPKCEFESLQTKTCGTCTKQTDDFCSIGFIEDSTYVTNSCEGDGRVCEGHSQCVAQLCNTTIIYSQTTNLPVYMQYVIRSDGQPISHYNLLCSKISDSDKSCPDQWKVIPTLYALNMSMYSLSYVTGVPAEYTYGRVPMFNGFFAGSWSWLQNLTMSYARAYGKLLVLSGVIFDYDSNGLADDQEIIKQNNAKYEVNIPTHIYQITIRCEQWRDTDSDVCLKNPSVLSFILPHRPNVTNCLTRDKYLRLHTARVRDIEILTNLQFFDQNLWGTEETIGLRTQIHEFLW